MNATLHRLPATTAVRPFVNFNAAGLSDVPDYDDKPLMDLIDWCEYTIPILKNRERIGGWSAICAWHNRISELHDLKRTAETEARARRLLPVSAGGKG